MNDIFILHTTNTKRFILIDAEDKDKVFAHNSKWRENYLGYATALSKLTGRSVFLHRVVLDAPKGSRVDHKFHRLFDCRKSELRFCSQRQNLANSLKRTYNVTSKYKGVCRKKTRGVWRAYIRTKTGFKHLGHFTNELDAAKAYNEAAIKLHGEFAQLNNLE